MTDQYEIRNMTPETAKWIRMSAAERAALDYAMYHDMLAEEAQLAALSGVAPLTTRMLNAKAKLVLRAMEAEIHDAEMKPEPRPHRCPCKPCRDWIEGLE